jgi:hypothetical protein
MSYKERSIWVSLFILLYIWADYFLALNTIYLAGNLTVSNIRGLLLDVVVLTIALEIGHHVLVAIIDNKNANYDEDERDRLITLKASNYAYYVLSFTAIGAILHLLFPIMSQGLTGAFQLPSEYIVVHLIIVGALLAEIAKFSVQLFFYRRGF